MDDRGFGDLASDPDEETDTATCPSCGGADAFAVVVHVAPGTQFPDDADPNPDGERRRGMACCSDCGTVYDPTLAARE